MEELVNSAAVLDAVGRGLGELGHPELEAFVSWDEESPSPKELSKSSSSSLERDVSILDALFDSVGSRAFPFAVDTEVTILRMNARHGLRRNVGPC